MSYAYDLLVRHKARGAIIDTNLLLLLIVGACDLSAIGRGRLQKYTINDYNLMMRIFRLLDRIIITPNIMTETDNLARQDIVDKSRLANVVCNIFNKVSEIYRPSNSAVGSREYEKVGLTDTHLLTMASEHYLTITDDLPLYHILETLRREAININHIRVM